MESHFIRDNFNYGNVEEFLNENITPDSKLSIVSAFFTIYAFDKLKEKLWSIDNLKFLFGDPSFLKSVDPDKKESREYKLDDNSHELALDNKLFQKAIANECSKWIKEKVQIRSIRKQNFLHGKLYHILQPSGKEKAIAGSSNFTVSGLGLGKSKNVELNIIIDGDRDREELKKWFDELWNENDDLVEDVKDQVLNTNRSVTVLVVFVCVR